MILRDEHNPAASAALAMSALTEAGVAPETATQVALAVGAAAATNAWSQPEMDFRLARTLHQLGHAEASRAMLRRAIPKCDADAAAILSAPAELLPLLRAGLLRAAGENSWRLDASALVKSEVAHELTYARLLETFADRLLPLWDSSGGRGVLALAGWRDHARLFGANRRAVARCCRSWRRDLDATLNRRALRRGWAASPCVILAEPL